MGATWWSLRPPSRPASSTVALGAVARRRRPRALVTGGAGFLGSHLCERLLSE
ncbi:MAG TPA: NAD-dependent epimerase/dehydratase family protein, partial [Rubrobacter sp.]|nr:NAD-dependent epimerase/dehydratase family protein [Rubrobacter sp.]